jgi:drug/metabolite transporter (DMT)-like permease
MAIFALVPALYGLAVAVFWGTGDFFSRSPSRKIGYLSSAIYVQMIGLVVLGAYTILSASEHRTLTHFTPTLLVFNLIAGVLSLVGFASLYRGFSTGIMSVVSPVANSYPFITVLISVVVLGTTISTVQGVAIVFVMVGILLAGIKLSELRRAGGGSGPQKLRSQERSPSTTTDSTQNPRSSPMLANGIGSALIACVSFGVLYIFLDLITARTDPVLPILVMRMTAVGVSFAWLFASRSRLALPRQSNIIFLLLMIGLLDTGGYLLFDAGTISAPNSLPIVTTFSGLVSPFTIVLASLFYKERLGKIQWLGVISIIVGVAVTLYL